MVATRRGVRVYSPTKTNPDQPPDVQATPSAGRRTRSAAKQAGSPTHDGQVLACSQSENSDRSPPECPLTSRGRRCARVSRLHSPEPSTPVGSTHECNISDMESACSIVSDNEVPLTSTRGRRRQPRTVNREDEETSEVESCSSVVSASKPVRSSRRSTRRKTVPESPAQDVKEDVVRDTESCSSVVSESHRVTRSQRKTTRTRSSSKQQTEDSEISDVDSCVSSVSGVETLKSATRRSTRARKPTRPIPMYLEELSESSESPSQTGRRTRSARGKAAVDSDSEVHSPVGSPCSTQSRGTPCSSRTGSGNSSRGARASRRSLKEFSVVVERAEDNSLDDSRLENTVIEDADCTLVEEDITSSEGGAKEEKINIISEVCHVSPSLSEAVSHPAVRVRDQQEEPSAERRDEDTPQMEMMQETEPVKPCPSVKVTVCERASEITEEAEKKHEVMDAAHVDAHASQTGQPLDEDDEDKMEVSTVNTDAEVESIQVTSSRQLKITVDFEPEPQIKDVTVQKTKTISLLDSSDDDDEEEEEEEEEREVSEDEGLGYRKEERGEPSNRSDEAAASVEGLFVIDTRPGQDADEHYLREGRSAEEATTSAKEAEGEEDDEEFVDEEGDDDDDDEGSSLLFSSRDPHLKELSSRIDPGIRVKELGGLYISFDGSKSNPASSSLQKLKEKKIQDEVMKKSVIGPDFAKKDAVPPYSESKQALKLKHRAEKAKSTGDGWFNMKAPELTQELKGDLQVLKMRGSLDPKRFYKKNDRDGFPKYFQVGTVVDSPVDFYHSRIPKKERKRTMMEELLQDAEFRHKNKKRYQQIMAEKAAQAAGKRNKMKSKFHKK
ncbi:deoxynucleotidyltransferase terminal-interacting protein 2 [Mugil cephalus]|uniref:deoxynucleotidyltransferase terminal-interacting protein 2 n=1 Tax=Mugil cephalus TaxID=48193 RepID=UPI001FB72594|nr:deoxynucleotidyltransferase terminal-interacting protein 2 [Mugil cephalus]